MFTECGNCCEMKEMNGFTCDDCRDNPEQYDVNAATTKPTDKKCSDCQQTVTPDKIIVPDPRTGRDRVQHICPDCGTNIKAGGGKFYSA